MKIKINYDLIEKIQQAKGEHKLKRYAKLGAKAAVPTIILSSVGTLIAGKYGDIPQEIITKLIAKNVALYTTIPLITTPITLKFIERRTGLTPEQSAMITLTELGSKLNNQYIKTSLPLLLESKQYHKEHKLVINKKGLPCIMQNKYIMIPTYDDEDIKETSILQEHQIGTKKYILSRGTPRQVKQLKKAYSI